MVTRGRSNPLFFVVLLWITTFPPIFGFLFFSRREPFASISRPRQAFNYFDCQCFIRHAQRSSARSQTKSKQLTRARDRPCFAHIHTPIRVCTQGENILRSWRQGTTFERVHPLSWAWGQGHREKYIYTVTAAYRSTYAPPSLGCRSFHR